MLEKFDDMMIKQYRENAAKLGLSLQEYLLYEVLKKLDDLKVTTYNGEE